MFVLSVEKLPRTQGCMRVLGSVPVNKAENTRRPKVSSSRQFIRQQRKNNLESWQSGERLTWHWLSGLFSS